MPSSSRSLRYTAAFTISALALLLGSPCHSLEETDSPPDPVTLTWDIDVFTVSSPQILNVQSGGSGTYTLTPKPGTEGIVTLVAKTTNSAGTILSDSDVVGVFNAPSPE